jgi:hypothetical protein
VNLQAPSPKAFNPAIPQVLEAIVLKCLEKDPACRYSNPLDLLKDLSGVQGDTYVPPVMPPIPPEEAEQTPLSPTVKVPAIGSEQPQLTRAITPKKMILFSAIGLVFLIIIGIVIFGKGGKPIPTPLPTVAQSEGRDVQAAAFVDKPTSTMTATQVNTATFTPSPTITFTLPPSNTPLPALTSTPAISFPDTFEDNHNGWNLDRVFNIVDGRIQAINLGERSTDWISCAGCEVTIGSGKVSVDMMWSYSEIHETAWQYTGLLLDDGTCSTVPIVFTLFYGNLNGTPYPSFELREMEPSQKSEYSFWFRYSTPKVKPGGIIKINRSPKEDINNMAAAYKRDIHGGLLIELYINGQYAWGTSVRTYNNSPVCKPGLFMFTTKIFFDNFNIEQ